MRVFVAVLAVLGAVVVSQARIITVDDDGGADFSTIQAAIDDSNDGDTVLVADGTYTGDGNRDIDFRGKAITVRSENGAENCIIDCNGTEADPHRGFYFHSGEDPNSAIIGFTITNGYADDGGGLYCIWSSPVVENCRFVANRASSGYGGAVRSLHGEGALRNCLLSSNTAATCGGGVALYNCRMTIENCMIIANTAERYDGGGIHLAERWSEVSNCTIVGNFAGGGRGAGGGGGGVWSGGDVVVTHCIIRSNNASTNPEIYLANSSRFVSVAYSNIEGGYSGTGNIDADPCFAEPGYWDPNGTPDDANDDFFIPGDYHFKSQGGRYDPNSQTWLTDEVTSLCIDAGDPMSPIGLEPFPNGGIINMGAFGGTPEASKSYFGKPPCEIIAAGDINGDCEVDFLDFRMMALHWLWLGGDTPVNSNSVVQDGIEYYMQTDKAVYALGENVQMLYKVTNLRDVYVECKFTCGPVYDRCDYIVEKDGGRIWDNLSRASTDAITYLGLPSSTSVDFTQWWDMTDFSDNEVMPGAYEITGMLSDLFFDLRGVRCVPVSVSIDIIP